MFPPWLQPVAAASPGYWALAMRRAAMQGDAPRTLAPAGVLLAIGAAAGVLAYRRLAHGWGRATMI